MKGMHSSLVMALAVLIVAGIVVMGGMFVSYLGVMDFSVFDIFRGGAESSFSRHIDYVYINEAPFSVASIALNLPRREAKAMFEGAISENYSVNISNTEKLLDSYNRFYRIDLVEGNDLSAHTIARASTEDLCGLRGVCEESCSVGRTADVTFSDECDNGKSCCVDDKDELNCGRYNEGICETDGCSFLRAEVSDYNKCDSGRICCKTIKKEDQLNIVRPAEIPIVFSSSVDYARVFIGD